MTEAELDELFASIQEEGHQVSREEVRRSVTLLAEIMLLAYEEFGPSMMPPAKPMDPTDLL